MLEPIYDTGELSGVELFEVVMEVQYFEEFLIDGEVPLGRSSNSELLLFSFS